MEWGEFVLALGAFFLSHALAVRPPIKGRIVGRIGARGFALAYSVLSVAVLAWLVVAAARAPFVELWPRQPWQGWVPIAAMLPVSLVLALTLGRPNPLSFGGANNAAFDTARPGLIAWMRHPVLVALLLWSLAHMVPNGDLAHVVLFGLFAAFSALGMRLIDARKQREMGQQAWQALVAGAREAGPLATDTRTAELWLRLAAAVVGYLGFFMLHGTLFGVAPVP